MKTRCVRRLEGDNAWNLKFLNLVLAVRGRRQQRARRRDPRSNKRMRWPVADVRKNCTYDRTFQTSTDVPQDAQVVLELDNTQRSAEQELNMKCWFLVMQKIQTSGNQEESVKEPDVSLKKRKIGEQDINPSDASSLTADTPKM